MRGAGLETGWHNLYYLWVVYYVNFVTIKQAFIFLIMSTLSEDENSDMKTLAKLTRKYIEENYLTSGKKGKEGTTFVATGKSGKEYAIKLFKATKSSNKLRDEAEYQMLAAEYGISPRVFAVNTETKYIVMEKMEETIVDYMKRKYPEKDSKKPLDVKQQKRIIEICEKLDCAKVVQNDGNPLNLMVDKKGTIMVIDFGFAKAIDKKMLKKRGPEPNIALTLWHMQRGFKSYKIVAPLLKERQEEYMKTSSSWANMPTKKCDSSTLKTEKKAEKTKKATKKKKKAIKEKAEKKAVKKAVKKVSEEEKLVKNTHVSFNVDNEQLQGEICREHKSRADNYTIKADDTGKFYKFIRRKDIVQNAQKSKKVKVKAKKVVKAKKAESDDDETDEETTDDEKTNPANDKPNTSPKKSSLDERLAANAAKRKERLSKR